MSLEVALDGDQSPAMKHTSIGAKRFDALWRRSSPSDGAAVYAELCRRYRAPYRHFHNLDHIKDCLHHVDEVAPLLDDPDAVELAVWFHDAVYEIGASTNERRSAEMFLELSQNLSARLRRRVCGLILATRHTETPQGNDRRFIVDIDLAGFGASWDVFMRNGALLRREFAAQTDVQYHKGQVAFLQRLQRRPRFFSTDHFRDRYEATARENLQRLLEDLTRRGYAA